MRKDQDEFNENIMVMGEEGQFQTNENHRLLLLIQTKEKMVRKCINLF